ncbi:Phage protein [Alloactinosynnema sp. L-07]|uniref:DUF5131 family protein n=1 Tax=Alloactinosynnema sp. L-07 TaxID=1653480 RepID=UPI00065EF449|nr:phage Gp37/Gp68 family protein [Alloactinosynnema sp. L-07]CRK59036.1 Phage protein [Alloactinosynnema sp. L-07]
MSDKTLISWTDATWSPVTGCTRISDGCLNCYIERTPPFRMTGRRFDLPIIGGTTGVQMHEDRLTVPLHWRKPRRVFVCSLADLFHESVPDEFIARVWATMASAADHSFQVLTKRHSRMRSLLCSEQFREDVCYHWVKLLTKGPSTPRIPPTDHWPLPNVWLGVSAESQRWADTRIPALLMTPAAVRWISAEPLLGPVDLTRVAWTKGGGTHLDVVHGRHGIPHVWTTEAERLDWVVAGGESGPGARPMHPDWARSLRDQCASAGVPFHFKQWGEWAPNGMWGKGNTDPRERFVGRANPDGEREVIRRVGKKTAGRELDGLIHDDYPAGAR